MNTMTQRSAPEARQAAATATQPAAGSLVLKATGLKKSFGAFTATNDVSFEVHAGDALAIIGPNGAGKSTLFDLLTGRKTPDAGSVELFGEPVTNLPPWQRVKRGIGRSFQVSSVFRAYSALENVQMGLMVSSGQSWRLLGRATNTRRDEAQAILDKVGLGPKRDMPAGDLSYGDQRTLELAVALSTRPRLLLLDEPTAGMGREESGECLGLIRDIATREQLPIVFVEHDMHVVFSFASRVIVMVAGQVLIDDLPEVVRSDNRVKEAYFGEDICDPILQVENLDAGYGHVKVIRDARLSVAPGEVVGLVGRNGAGKTTFLSSLIGMVTSTRGSIRLGGQEIADLPTHERVHQGLAISPSGGRLFKSLTVEENLLLGLGTADPSVLAPVLQLFPELEKLRTRHAGKLSGGERQMVAIGRALVLKPRLLLFDEPSEGLAPIVVLRVAEAIKALRETGIAMLVAEQNIKFTNLICQSWFHIDKGRITPLADPDAAAQLH